MIGPAKNKNTQRRALRLRESAVTGSRVGRGARTTMRVREKKLKRSKAWRFLRLCVFFLVCEMGMQCPKLKSNKVKRSGFLPNTEPPTKCSRFALNSLLAVRTYTSIICRAMEW